MNKLQKLIITGLALTCIFALYQYYLYSIRLVPLPTIINNQPLTTNSSVPEVARVESYIRKHITTLAPTEPVLGGSWYVVSVTADPSDRSGTVVYEDGHIQDTAHFVYAISGGKVEIISITKQ